jgi:hypothetical protein
MDSTKSKTDSAAKPAARRCRKSARGEIPGASGAATGLLAEAPQQANSSSTVEVSSSQICVVAPEFEPSPSNGGWGLRRGPHPVSSGEAILRATHLRAKVAATPGDLLNPYDLETASRWDAWAASDPPDPVRSTGGELVPTDIDHDPSYITADASKSRLDLAHDAGVLEMALDAAETIGAANSFEKMLSHLMVASYNSAMKLTVQQNRCIERMNDPHPPTREQANIQATRLAGAISRHNGNLQSGMITMQRIRTGGTQTVLVQHVNVNDGGQAVVAGELATGRTAATGGAKRRGRGVS